MGPNGKSVLSEKESSLEVGGVLGLKVKTSVSNQLFSFSDPETLLLT
jgi:hypothetical protein